MTESSVDQDYQLFRQKIIFCGDAGVGKTSIINSFMSQKFQDEYEPSIGVDFFSKTVRYKDRLIKLQIWDSAGQEKFRSLIPNYIRGSSLIFLIYDISNKISYEHIPDWIQFIKNVDNNGIIILVGNKIDLNDKREIDNTSYNTDPNNNSNFADLNHNYGVNKNGLLKTLTKKKESVLVKIYINIYTFLRHINIKKHLFFNNYY